MYQYSRPLHQIKVLEKAVYEDKQTSSLGEYITNLESTLSQITVKVPDILKTVILLHNMAPTVRGRMMESPDMLQLTYSDFCGQAVLLDDSQPLANQSPKGAGTHSGQVRGHERTVQ